jgi:hypothetical protein
MEGKIYSAIPAIIGEIGAIGKNKRNQQQNFAYRGVDDFMNALQPLLAKHNIFIVPEVVEHDRRERTTVKGASLIYSVLKIKYTFFADDGSNVCAVVIGEGMDSGDKSSNKALSIAFKYACMQIFCVATEELKDPDAETHDYIIPPKITNAQLAALEELGVDINKMAEFFKCEVYEIHAEQAEKIIKKKRKERENVQ